jgi:hypothetical protein
MMADVRLIDANVLPNYKCRVTATIGDRKGPAEMRFVFWQDIEKAPTIDAVPVVRCRECVLRGSDYCPMCHDEYTYDEDDGGDYYTVDNTDDDGFCHIGKREV